MTRYAIPALIALLLGSIYWIDRVTTQRDLAVMDATAARDTLAQVTATAYRKEAEAVEQKALNTIMGQRYANLQAQLRKRDEKPSFIAQATITARDDSGHAALVGRSAMHDSIAAMSVSIPDSVFDFIMRSGRHDVTGRVRIPSSISMVIRDDPLRLGIVITERKGAQPTLYVDVGDSTLTIGDLDVKFVPRKRSLWDRHDGKIALIIGGVIGVLAGSL